ncbi:YadA-like family protein [Negativicoccus succinicivorans]|nr:YadA-like family protein [Negativicoccus succinicivorans]
MAKAEGVYSLAAGYGSSATGEAAYAFGVDSKADGGDALAIGSAAEAQKDGGIAIGSTAIATQEFGVALGAGSIADRDAGVSGYLAGDATSEAWQATVAAVAVGNEEEGFTRQVTGVAAGTEDTDAVNVVQLKKLASNVNEQMTGLDTRITTNTENITANTEKITVLNGRVDRLDTRVDRIGAGAAALAGLHPLDYDPENKWDFAASYGNYNGANAVAIGAFYRPTANRMFSVGGSFGGGENMLNVGFSMKVGQETGISTSKIAMANEIRDLKTANEKMQQENKFMQQENKEMKNEIEILKQQVQQLMATK